MSAGYVSLNLLPEPWRILGVAFFVVLIVVGNGVRHKYKFPGIKMKDSTSYYVRPVELSDVTIGSSVSHNGNDKTVGNKQADFLFEPVAGLEEWRKSFTDKIPKLVIVTTSGGAYRAAFWTAIVLDMLEAESENDKDLPGFTANIRLITGASGGMVGAAYFSAAREVKGSETIVGQLVKDTKEAQLHTRLGTKFPIPRDTLSPVVQQFAQRDVLNTFLPWAQDMDRGRVLESQWRTLDTTFAQLREGELQGWRPSLILSPMLVETGQPLLISNLNLSALSNLSRSEAVEFFRLFPEAHDSFRLQTAVRMNATFPYISPAVSLPTKPSRRVVDAGYYDNYGVNLAVAYLREPAISKWVRENTSGVIVVQIRAFPIESVGEERGDDLCQEYIVRDQETRWDRAFQWLTSPLEGAAAARDASMVFRNNQDLRALQELYEPGFIASVTLENATKASMSWYLPGWELECMRKELGTAYNTKELKKLKKVWNDEG